MSRQLIIAEKPSVAQDIARALGGFTRQGEWYESEAYLLASAIGHLLELVAPAEYEVKRGKWSFAHLPVLPSQFALQPIAKTAERLNQLTRLMQRKDVIGLINACDAGREGELIFRYLVQHAFGECCPKPIRRLWLQSMTLAAIRAGFVRLRSDAEMQPLADAARCRSEADWLIGINGTRAMTAFNSQEGGFYKTTVGRVQTPTLAILVEREERIREFVPRGYWEVEAEFRAAAGTYCGRWYDEAFVKGQDEHARAERLWQPERAEVIRAACLGRHAEIEEEKRPKSELPPLLYDLTSLQREANGRFGFSARTTLQLAQALYERHKVITYPRTDSRHLPEDYLAMVGDTLRALEAPYASHAAAILEAGWVQPNMRIFADAKVTDHFAIIPTGTQARLGEMEQKLYDLVVRRFLAVFFPAAEYHVTTRISRVDGADGRRHAFKSEGKVLCLPGWLAVYGKEVVGVDETRLVAVVPGERVQVVDVEVKGKSTQPPARFTEATLLTAMEGAGKLVEDEELRAAMSERGLGTPATRAAIIENLIAEEYVQRKGRELQPTAKAFSLLFVLDKLGIDEIRSPELTGQWEWKLREMEHGRLARREFMQQIAEQAQRMVERIKQGRLPEGTFGELAVPCPQCGGVVRETYKRFACVACDWKVWKVLAGRQWEVDEMVALLRRRHIGPLDGFRSKMGRTFSALVRLNEEGQPVFDFGEERAGSAVDFCADAALGPCPKCGARIFERGSAYVCEKAVGLEKTCDFRVGKLILQQELTRSEMQKLLGEKKSSLLRGFVSNRTKKRFSAHLVIDGGGRIGFEFEARAPKAARSRRSAGVDDAV